MTISLDTEGLRAAGVGTKARALPSQGNTTTGTTVSSSILSQINCLVLNVTGPGIASDPTYAPYSCSNSSGTSTGTAPLPATPLPTTTQPANGPTTAADLPTAATSSPVGKFSPISFQWTWVGGPQGQGQTGFYGTMGLADPGNMPGSRNGAAGWVDTTGAFWLFGGIGYDGSGSPGSLEDFWVYHLPQ